MTDKEKIRAEVKRRKDELHYLPFTDENLGKINAYEFVLKIIDSLPNEPVSEDLKEVADNYASGYKQVGYDEDHILSVSDGFIDGANWHKEQMMKVVVDAEVTDTRTYKHENEVDFTLMLEKGIIPYEIGEEVKLIIIKED